MSLFIATGSNQGNRQQNLLTAKDNLSKIFEMIAASRIYESPAVDYLEQPDFYNQVLEFKTPSLSPSAVMNRLLNLEKKMGRNRDIPKGPRVIDLDILFWDLEEINTDNVIIPHPRLFARSFVVLPLSELPGFLQLKKKFSFPPQFDNTATPLS